MGPRLLTPAHSLFQSVRRNVPAETSAHLLVAGQRTEDARTTEAGRVRVGQEAATQLQVQVGAGVPALLGTRLVEVAYVASALKTLIGEKAAVSRALSVFRSCSVVWVPGF